MTIFFSLSRKLHYYGRLCYLAILPLLPCVPRLLSSLSRPYPRDCYKELLRRIFTFLPRKHLALEGQRGTGLGMIVKLLCGSVCMINLGQTLRFPLHPSPRQSRVRGGLLWHDASNIEMTDEDHATSPARRSFVLRGNPSPPCPWKKR